MDKRNLRQEKYVENISNVALTELHSTGLETGGAITCPMEKTELSIARAKRCFLVHDDPDYWSAVPVRTQRVLQLLTSTWQSHVSL
jgi:hypothetical protein